MQSTRTKVCTKCGLTWPAANFCRKGTAKDGLSPWCRACHKASTKRNRTGWRQILLNHYHNECKWCGFNIPEFLQNEHVFDDGAQHRKRAYGRLGTGSLTRAIVIDVANGLDFLYTLLCPICNTGKAQNGNRYPPKMRDFYRKARRETWAAILRRGSSVAVA